MNRNSPEKPLKLIVMIPAYNEEETIGRVIKSIPRKIEGIDLVEVLLVDDGSRDSTIENARKSGVDYMISNGRNIGLARSFKIALEKALKLGADIIVNTDADNQYNQAEIPKLIRPIQDDEADMVIGNRQVAKLTHMTSSKKWGNLALSGFLRLILQNNVGDASSGFRAYSRTCASRLVITSTYTYTHESIIRCHFQGMKIKEIPVEFIARENGESRLIRGLFKHMILSGLTILKIYIDHLFRRFRGHITHKTM